MPGTLGFKICHVFSYKKLEPTEDENIIYVTLNLRYFFFRTEEQLSVRAISNVGLYLYSIIVIPLKLTYLVTI